MSALLIAAAAFVAVALWPASAQAGTIDQQHPGSGNVGVVIGNTKPIAQTFTAGLDGELDQVDLLLSKFGDPPGDLSLEIREVSGGEPTTTVLDTATISEASIPGSFQFAFVSVPVSAPSVAGTEYAIVLQGPIDGCEPNCYLWGITSDDSYAGGALFVSFDSGVNWDPTGDGFDDGGFKTYVAEASCQTPDGIDADYFETVIGDVPSGYWRLGENAGPTALDSSGLMRHGAYTGTFNFGAPGAISGDTDTAVDFAPDPKARVPTPYNPFQANSTRTFEGWACRAENKGFDVFFSGDRRFNSPGLWTDHSDLDRIWFDPRREGGTAPRFWDGVMPPDEAWFHWVLVFNDATNTAELFINSISQGTRSVTEPYHSSPGNFQIGNYAQINEAWNGPLDELAVYERALTPEEICVHFTSGIGAPDCAAP